MRKEYIKAGQEYRGPGADGMSSVPKTAEEDIILIHGDAGHTCELPVRFLMDNQTEIMTALNRRKARR